MWRNLKGLMQCSPGGAAASSRPRPRPGAGSESGRSMLPSARPHPPPISRVVPPGPPPSGVVVVFVVAAANGPHRSLGGVLSAVPPCPWMLRSQHGPVPACLQDRACRGVPQGRAAGQVHGRPPAGEGGPLRRRRGRRRRVRGRPHPGLWGDRRGRRHDRGIGRRSRPLPPPPSPGGDPRRTIRPSLRRRRTPPPPLPPPLRLTFDSRDSSIASPKGGVLLPMKVVSQICETGTGRMRAISQRRRCGRRGLTAVAEGRERRRGRGMTEGVEGGGACKNFNVTPRSVDENEGIARSTERTSLNFPPFMSGVKTWSPTRAARACKL